MIRKTSFVFALMLLFVITIGSIVYSLFLSDGLDLKVTNSGKNTISVLVRNNSDHMIRNIELYLNNKQINAIAKLKPKETFEDEFVISKPENIIKVIALYHKPVIKKIVVNYYENKSDVFFDVAFQDIVFNKKSQIKFKICNESKDMLFNVWLTDSTKMLVDKSVQSIFVKKATCKTVYFNITPVAKGELDLKFKVNYEDNVKYITQKININ